MIEHYEARAYRELCRSTIHTPPQYSLCPSRAHCAAHSHVLSTRSSPTGLCRAFVCGGAGERAHFHRGRPSNAIYIPNMFWRDCTLTVHFISSSPAIGIYHHRLALGCALSRALYSAVALAPLGSGWLVGGGAGGVSSGPVCLYKTNPDCILYTHTAEHIYLLLPAVPTHEKDLFLYLEFLNGSHHHYTRI